MNIKRICEMADMVLAAGFPAKFKEPIFPPSVYYNFFYYMNQEFKFPLAVELGVCGGGGSYYLCKGNPDGKVVGVDYKNDCPSHIEYIKKECPNYTFIQDDAYKVAANIWNDFGTIDFLFIDTVHTYEDTMKIFNIYYPFLSDKAIICLDDLLRPGMQKAYEELPGIKVRNDLLHLGGSFEDGGFCSIILGDE